MVQNLKMIYFLGSQRNSELKGKSIHLRTDLNLMDILRDFTNSSKVVKQNTSLDTENGMMLYLLLQHHTTGYQTSTQKNCHSLSCLARDALTNLSHLTKPNLRYMGTEDLILDLELMSSIFQTQIHNLRMARERVIEGQQLVTKPNIAVGDLVLVRDHTSKCFMPKYKVGLLCCQN